MKIAAALLLALAASCAWADTLTGRVVAVLDGDTITVLDASRQEHRIRLSGIDAPEKAQSFGQASKQALSDQIYDRQVEVETSKRDKYGREIGKVRIGGADANLEQIRRGLAWHYKRFQNEQPLEDRLAYLQAEDEARAARRGLWSEPGAVAPWDWRKR